MSVREPRDCPQPGALLARAVRAYGPLPASWWQHFALEAVRLALASAAADTSRRPGLIEAAIRSELVRLQGPTGERATR